MLDINKVEDLGFNRFKGKLACFRYVGIKEIMLIQDPEIYDPESNKWIKYERDHFWMDCTNKKINKKLQGKIITFIGKEYEYSNSIGKTQKGIQLKYSNLIRELKGK